MLGGPRRRWFPLYLEAFQLYNTKVPEDAGVAQTFIDSVMEDNPLIQAFSDREWEEKGIVRDLSCSR